MLKITKMLAVVMCVVLGLTSTAPAQWTNWHDTEHGPVTTGNLWSDDANWTNGAPTVGMSFRIEQYAADAAGTGAIIMDVDYSADALGTAQFYGAETVSIQEYFKVNGSIHLNNGGNAVDGSYIRVEPTGTISGNITFGSEWHRNPPILDFAGGDWVAGNVTTSEGFRQGGIIKVSTNSGALTPGNFNVSLAPTEIWEDLPGFEFALAAGGVTPINLTDGDPLQWTGDATGARPFRLMVDTSLYTGGPGDIPLFIFQNSTTETDRMFDGDADNISITGVPEGWLATVAQTDSGVTLNLAMLVAPGDTNADKKVDAFDLDRFEAQFGGAPDASFGADFNGDGIVDLDDFAVIRGNWGFDGSAPLPAAPGAETPEPATMSLLALGGLAIIRRRRRKA